MTVTVARVASGVPADLAALLAEEFTSTFGPRPDGVHAAPGRVNLIGEHTDYNDGLCLPLALPHATYVAAAVNGGQTLRVRSTTQPNPFEAPIDQLGPGDVTGWAAYAAGVIWAMREEGIEVPALDLMIDSTVPLGAGLSSSAALECAVALAACAAAGLEVNDKVRHTLLTACMRAESEVAGAPTGGMDQAISLLAQPDHALLLDCRDWQATQVPCDFSAAGLELLVVDTKAEHALIDGQYAVRRTQCETAAVRLGVHALRDVTDVEAVEALDDDVLRRRARHVVTEISRVQEAVSALRVGDMSTLGGLFNASHASLRDDYQVTCPELDLVVEVAADQGALGARMTGGGFGGSAIALVPSGDVDRVEHAIADAFAARRFHAPEFLRAIPAAGAQQIA